MASLSASTIILQYICPCLGMLIANCMWLAPLQDLQRAVARKSLRSLNPTPWAVMLGNCYGWCLYGILTANFWVYFANAPGVLLSVWLNLGAVKLLYEEHHATQMRRSLFEYYHHEKEDEEVSKQQRRQSTEMVGVTTTAPLPPTSDKKQDDANEEGNNNNDNATTAPLANAKDNLAKRIWDVTAQTTPAKTPHERLVLIVVALWMAISSIIGFAGSTEWIQNNANWPSHTTNVAIVGYAVNLNLVFFYAAPLSTIWTVLQHRNSNSIHLPTLVTNTLNGTFWLAYGVAIVDWFIIVPNGLGALLGVVQVVLLVLFPRTSTKTKMDSAGDNGGDENDDGAIVAVSTDNVLKAMMETDDSSGDPEQHQQQRQSDSSAIAVSNDVEMSLQDHESR